MSGYFEAINKHYGSHNLGLKILKSLADAGLNLDNLSREDLVSFEEFHIGGRGETRNLAQMADLRKGVHVLDAGCGIGGPARTLAAEFGCKVTGLDLTLAYCDAATMLTARVNMAALVDFRHGSALEMPFDDGVFDVVWMQHISMNIEDKAALYREIRRVVRPGGRLVFHDIMAGDGSELHFPVFWTDKPSLNFLTGPEHIRQLLAECGFEQFHWEDVTERSIQWFEGNKTRLEKDGPPPLGLDVIVGRNVPQKAANVSRNLVEGKIVAIQAGFERPKV